MTRSNLKGIVTKISVKGFALAPLQMKGYSNLLRDKVIE